MSERARFRFFQGLDGRWGVRAQVFQRTRRKWQLRARILYPAIAPDRAEALAGWLQFHGREAWA